MPLSSRPRFLFKAGPRLRLQRFRQPRSLRASLPRLLLLFVQATHQLIRAYTVMSNLRTFKAFLPQSRFKLADTVLQLEMQSLCLLQLQLFTVKLLRHVNSLERPVRVQATLLLSAQEGKDSRPVVLGTHFTSYLGRIRCGRLWGRGTLRVSSRRAEGPRTPA